MRARGVDTRGLSAAASPPPPPQEAAPAAAAAPLETPSPAAPARPRNSEQTADVYVGPLAVTLRRVKARVRHARAREAHSPDTAWACPRWCAAALPL
jgi:hypothetical protein